MENNILHGYQSDTYFPHRDYNLYWDLFPKLDRNFTSVYADGHNHYYPITEWASYLTHFPTYDNNSPTPEDPYFINYTNKDYRLTDSSAAMWAGTILPYIVITDPSGQKDTINKYDITGFQRNISSPSLGAYEYREVEIPNSIQNVKTSDLIEIYPNPALGFCVVSVSTSVIEMRVLKDISKES